MTKRITTDDNCPALIGTGYMVELLSYIHNLDGQISSNIGASE